MSEVITGWLAGFEWETEVMVVARALNVEWPSAVGLSEDERWEYLTNLTDALWNSEMGGTILCTLFMSSPDLEKTMPKCFIQRLDHARRVYAAGK
jgi:hypothetical protein